MRILQFLQFLRTFLTESIELGSGYNEVKLKIAKTKIKCPEVMIFLRSHGKNKKFQLDFGGTVKIRKCSNGTSVGSTCKLGCARKSYKVAFLLKLTRFLNF